MMKKTILLLAFVAGILKAQAIDLTKATIVYQKGDAPLVAQMAQVLAEDIERVSGKAPLLSPQLGGRSNTRQLLPQSGEAGRGLIVLATVKCTNRHRELRGTWERYAIDTKDNTLYITGSDARGLAYGVLHVSEAIGVSPWYWWADVPVAVQSQQTEKRGRGNVYDYEENMVSKSPTVKYRGFFINDEDWGLKTWAAQTFEKELGDIGPKTYDRVCELILRLKGNMLAPAMHSCTGAFYSHPESQRMADKWGIMITTSHCEPLLFNNAAKSEWDKARDGEWNYETNSQTILKKLDDRIRETAQYDNIYTMGMRGLHDEAMKGSTDPADRARTLEKVIAKQRGILEKYKKQKAAKLPQIFVPYKETLDIYDAGLRVPDDITLVWPDDNYGYMKRVSNAAEQRRSGHSGVYYHLSYLGTPHDNLWIATTAPMLMYEELKKAYDAGADRYWLLNVGDIKPMEIEMQQFFDMAYDFTAFTYDNANRYQAQWLAKTFTLHSSGEADSSLFTLHSSLFQFILDNYYRLAWDRKPEFMGYEYEWDSQENNRLHDTDFSFETGTAQRRLMDYQTICDTYDMIERSLSPEQRPALFEMLGYAVHSAYQMNRKFLYAQRNHETGSAVYAEMSREANREIERLRKRYNEQLGGNGWSSESRQARLDGQVVTDEGVAKWNQMISTVPPGYTAKYHQMPELTDQKTDAYRLPDAQRHPEFRNKIDLSALTVTPPFRLLEGIGTDWVGLQMGDNSGAARLNDSGKMINDNGEMFNVQCSMFNENYSIDIPLQSNHISHLSSLTSPLSICLSVVPMWPVAYDRSNRIAVSLDGGEPVVCENKFTEWSPEWKLQVLENRKEFVLSLPLDTTRRDHVLTLTIVDPGQIVQKITWQ